MFINGKPQSWPVAGASASKLGSNGSGYRLAECLGHHVPAPVPALCALHCKEKYFKELAGIRLQGRVRLLTSGKVAAEDGEIQLTAYGISGIPVFQVSRYAASFANEKNSDSGT